MYDNSSAASVNVTTSKTLALTDAGIQQRVVKDGLTLTLPAAGSTPVGTEFIIKNGGLLPTVGTPGTGYNKAIGYTLAPQAADGIGGLGITPAVNKGIAYVKSTGFVNDTLVVRCTGVTGATGWVVVAATLGNKNTTPAVQYARVP